MPLLSSARSLTLGALVGLTVFAALATVPTASAQLDQLPGGQITISADAFSPRTAIPEGPPAVANLTIAYTCGGFTGDITLVATVVQGSGTPTLNTTTITPQTVPDCEPPGDVSTRVSLSVVAGTEGLAGSIIVVNVTATATTLFQQEEVASFETGPVMGPIVDVTFQVPVERFEVEAGAAANASFTVTSMSNDLIMAMPEIDGLPVSWTRPDIPARTVDPATAGANERTVEFQIEVPPNAAPGDYTMDLVLFAHSVSEPDVESDPQRFPLTVTVTAPPAAEGEGNESPPAGAVPLVVALAAVVALLRRRA